MGNNIRHTPGPWSLGIIKDNPASARSMAVWPDSVEVGQVAEPVCLIAPMANYNERDEANASLIAAAPDLLAALESVESWVSKTYPWDKSEPLNSILKQARAAIAKATGK